LSGFVLAILNFWTKVFILFSRFLNMNQELYRKTEQFVIDSFNKADKSWQIKHFFRTVYWIKKLKPDADDSLLISAVAHDIERAFRQEDVLKMKQYAGYTDLNWLRVHEERGAKIIEDFLERQGATTELIEKVKILVARHEEGGSDDQNLLKDTDSISFFENYVSFFLTKRIKEIGKEKVKEKFDWMFNRITSEKAKEIARPLYKEAIKNLD